VGAASRRPDRFIGGRRTISSDTEKTQVLPPKRQMPVVDDLPPARDGGIEDEGHRRAAVEAAQAPAPRLARGIELIGEYEGSGFKEPPYIARRADGQMVQMAKLLYLVAAELDGKRSYAEIGERVSESFGRGLDAELTQVIVEEKLVPLGIAAPTKGEEPELKKIDPLLALKFRAAVVPEGLVNAVTRVFHPLFYPPVIVAVLGGLVTLDVWLFGYHGVAQSVRSVLYDPLFILLLLGLVVVSAAFHECGHATACKYGGARPGVMGVGVYIVYPAFYTDVTDAYRLDKKGRLRTDLGGVYFNTIFILLTAGAYFLTGFEPLLLIIPIQHLEILHQFLPFIRLDGYYIVSDLTGVPDMFMRIKPVLKSLLPWKEADDRVKELKTWARVAVTVYVLTLVPALAFLLGMMVINLPRVFGTAYDSFVVTMHKLGDAGAIAMVVDVFQLIVLLLVPLGLVVTLVQLARKAAVGSWRVTEGKPAARALVVVGAAAIAGTAAYAWYPINSVAKPIQSGERGTLGGAVGQISRLPQGGAPAPHTAPSSPAGQGGVTDTTTGKTSTTKTSTSTTTTATTTGTTTGASTTSTAPTATSTTATTTHSTTTAPAQTTTTTPAAATTTATTTEATTTTSPTTTTTP
jgi:putative peptide zinc metalloprotease protein